MGIDGISHIVSRLTIQSGLVSFVRYMEARRENLLRVLAYHRIGNPETEDGLLDPDLVSATPEMFEQQMRFLAANYRPLSVPDLLHAIDTRKSLPPQSVLVTFDDGYRDFLDIAWPILECYHIPAVLFVATGFLSSGDHLFWWDRLFQGIFRTRHTKLDLGSVGLFPLETKYQRRHALALLKEQIHRLDYETALSLVDTILQQLEVTPQTSGLVLNWSDARFLHDRGCYLAAHTRAHPVLSRIPISRARQEIRGAQQDIYNEIGTVWPLFAYPHGLTPDVSDDLFPILRDEGVRLAMTLVPGINVLPRTNLFRLKRIPLSPRRTMPAFPLYLTGVFHFSCSIRQLYDPDF